MFISLVTFIGLERAFHPYALHYAGWLFLFESELYAYDGVEFRL